LDSASEIAAERGRLRARGFAGTLPTMPYDEILAQRVRTFFGRRRNLVEKKMFGGLAFMLKGNMCCCIVHDSLMARVGPAEYQTALQQPHVREMDLTGRPLTGFVLVDAAGIVADADLAEWLTRCEKFANSLPAK
jgi:hypothetical protein